MSESDDGRAAGGPCVKRCDGREQVGCLLLLPSYSCLKHPNSSSTCIFLLPAWLYSSGCHSYAAMSEFIGCARPIESRRVAS